jgi:agmatine deiminase
VLVDVPAFQDASDPWVAVAERTRAQIGAARRRNGDAFEVVEIVQPQTTRVESDDFLATYMNYYVCNGAVIAPEFGDAAADAAAAAVLQRLFPNRTIVQVNIDALAAGGGGIHCATQQQPKVG